jgi:hypothetical protein
MTKIVKQCLLAFPPLWVSHYTCGMNFAERKLSPSIMSVGPFMS